MTDVIGLEPRSAQHTAHRQRPVVLPRVGLGERLNHLRAERVANEEAALGPSDSRCEDAAKLVCTLDTILDGVPVFAKAGVRNGKSRLTQRIAKRAGIIPV